MNIGILGTGRVARILGQHWTAAGHKVTFGSRNPESRNPESKGELDEKLQAALPGAKVVKTLNTAAMTVLTDPAALPPSSLFLSGDDADAKATVTALLKDFGWADESIVDLGGIASARGTEHYFLMFAAIMQSVGSPAFNIRLVR
jgi:predicted dinucleotide-binding enzyme